MLLVVEGSAEIKQGRNGKNVIGAFENMVSGLGKGWRGYMMQKEMDRKRCRENMEGIHPLYIFSSCSMVAAFMILSRNKIAGLQVTGWSYRIVS